MLMADTMAIFFVFLGMLLAFPGLWLLCRGIWPNSVMAACDKCKRRIWPSFLFGIPSVLVAVLITIALSKLPGAGGKVAAIAFISVFIFCASVGVAGLATLIGERLRRNDNTDSPYKYTLTGGIVLELSYLLPILGWFIILPGSYIIGSGLVFQTMLLSFKKQSVTIEPSLLSQSPSTSSRLMEENLDEPFGAT